MNTFVKSFVIPFVIAAVIFSVISIAVFPPFIKMAFSSDKKKGATEDEYTDANGSSAYGSLASNARGTLVFLIICTDETAAPSADGQSDLPEEDENASTKKEFDDIALGSRYPITKNVNFITLAAFDSLTNRTAVTYLPPETVVEFRGEDVDLDTMLYLAENGMYGIGYDFFSDYLLSLTGYRADFYGLIDIDDYVKFADDHKGLILSLAESIVATNKNGLSTPYQGGEITVDSTSLYDILTCDSYVNYLSKAEAVDSYTISALDEITTLEYFADEAAGFVKCASRFYKTNADHELFKEKISLFFSHTVYSHSKINITGALTSEDGKLRFTPNQSTSINAFK